jgi:hypothetical protein
VCGLPVGLDQFLHGAAQQRLAPKGRLHRFIGIWAVVVEGRVFVPSCILKPRSWYRTFLAEPRGAVMVAGREIGARADNLAREGSAAMTRLACAAIVTEVVESLTLLAR